MPKKQNKNKFLETVIEGNLKETNIVQKSNPLFSLWKSALTLSEFKILDTYLSRINSRDPEHRTVVFEKGELEKLLGVTKINQPELNKRLEHLQSTILSIGEGRNIDKITLFERSQAVQDEYGLWQIKLTASLSAMKYIFNIEKIGYFRYQIRNIAKIKSLHSYILFTYFEHYMHGNKCKWTIELEELKKMLNCIDKTYEEYKRFNDLVLKKCQKEIAEKTDLSFTYSTIRKNRKVAVIVFEVERVKRIEEIFADKKSELSPEQILKEQPPSVPFYDDSEFPQIPDYDQAFSPSQSEPLKTPLYSGFHSFETDFTSEQIQCLSLILETKLGFSTPERIDQLLRGLYAKCKEACPDARKPFAYLLKAVENLPVEESAKPKQKDEDNDCNADEYKFFVNNWDLIEAEQRQRNEARKAEVTEVDAEETAEERKKRENDEWWAEHMALIKR